MADFGALGGKVSEGEVQASSGVNQQIDFFRERVGHFTNHVAAKQIDQCVALRRAENDAGGADRRRDIDNRFGRGWTNGVTEQRRDGRRLLFRFFENGAGFGIFLPFALGVLLRS